MSYLVNLPALFWAFDQHPECAADKAVLVGIVAFCGRDGEFCFPGQDTLARWSCCSEDSLQRSIRRLEEGGFIRIERPKERTGKRMSNRYYLNFDVRTRAPNGTETVHRAGPADQPDLPNLSHAASCGVAGGAVAESSEADQGVAGADPASHAATCGMDETAPQTIPQTIPQTMPQLAALKKTKEVKEGKEEHTHTPARDPADPDAAPGRVCVGGGKLVDDLVAAGGAPHVVEHLIAPLLGVLRMPSGVDPTAFLAAICAECEEFADGALAEGAAVLRGARSYWPSPAQAKAAVAAVQPRHTIRITPADATSWAAWMAEYHRRGHRFLARQAQQDGFIRVPRPFPLVRTGRAA